MACRVRECRFPNSHTTVAHRCGTCGQFGHGQIECQNIPLREGLVRFHGERINFLRRCTVPNCPHPETHSAEAHQCTKCNRRHFEDNCIIQDLETHRHRFHGDNVQYFNEMNFRNVHRVGSVVVPIPLGMGCQLFIREKDGEMSSLFMHSDSWGQYGPSEDYDVYTEFVDGCEMLEANSFCQLPEPPEVNDIDDGEDAINERDIECPICRTINLETQVSVVYGLEVRCSVCLEANVDRFFQGCGHACVCHTCLEHL